MRALYEPWTGSVIDDVEGFQVLVASVDDLIRMKRAAARPKDRQHIELLAAVREEIDAGR